MTEEAQEKKSAKKFVLPPAARLMMVNFLESQNIMDVDSMEDEAILKEYNACTLKMQEKVNHYETSAETKNINKYIVSNDKLRINDKELIMRLFKINVPSIYLHLFKDADSELSDKEIWQVINKSGIDPLKDPSAIYKMRRSPIKQKII